MNGETKARQGSRVAGNRSGGLWAYVQLARTDHWFKNLFMVLGIVVAWFYEPEMLVPGVLVPLLLAVLATCLAASSNYVLNEILDGATDREHPVKKDRPVASGRVSVGVALVEWAALGIAGLVLGWMVGPAFALALLALLVMGILYNLPPIRTKETAYLDVITESVNNPIRLLLGWFAIIPDRLPPISLILAYWALGAYFMATKRFAELRAIGDPSRAARYRRSFAHYTENRLLVSMFFYVCAFCFFGGVFIVRCKLELVLMVPLVAGHLASYLALGLRSGSPAQAPERLWREGGFMAYTFLVFAAFVVLMFSEIPLLYDLFHFDLPKTPTLWRF